MKLDEAQAEVRKAQSRGSRVVFTNGVFDVLHVGHLRYLREARALGDMLIVGLNSDRSVRALKGALRPLVPQEEREELLLALDPVDIVVIFDEPTAEQAVAALRPDIYVKGGDYDVEQLPEARIVESNGGQVRILQLVKGHSTTDLIDVIRERYCP